ncbi:MAG: hypothetical protein WC682_02030 [Parcubacteria group bacterium]|jgi:tRNA A37 threonylcarbamoyladenosine modification protein TsaB
MNITLEIRENKAILYLMREKEIVDELKWEGDLNLSEKLLVNMDNLLIKNNLKNVDISKMIVKTSIAGNLTTVRVARIVAKTFNFKGCVN